MYELSILIPARNEEFLNNTIEDILKNKRAKTEIIVLLDGQWAREPIPMHDDVTIVYVPESVGQRAGTNLICKLSTAKYVMKLDAHCKVSEGFDKQLIADMDDDITMVPKMYNLHVFDRVCECGHRLYQGPTVKCEKCGKEMKKEIIWREKKSPETTAMRFDNNLKFQYWGDYKKKQKGDLVETMSILGACFMLTRNKYWELDICDEGHGSWGQQGTEVALKTWLSGGRLLVNKKCWFAHMFRTQGGDFGFPYELKGSDVQKAREYSKNLWLGGNWDKAKYDLQWVINKFSPVPDWNTKGIIYYTDNQLKLKIAKKAQKILKDTGLPITSASLKPMNFGNNIHVKMKRGREAYYEQIITALENSKEDIVFFCEHDVFYHPSHFDFVPPRKDKFYFNTNVWKINTKEGYGVKVDNCKQVSGLCCYRELALKHYKQCAKDAHYEPQENRESWESEYPNLDIRHESNFTKSRWSKDQFKNKKYTEGWTESNNIPDWELDKIISSII